MSDDDELEQYAWYSEPGECIVLQLGRDTFDIREALYLRYQLDQAIGDYTKAAGR